MDGGDLESGGIQSDEFKRFCAGEAAIFSSVLKRGYGNRGVDWYYTLRLAEAFAWEKLGTRPAPQWSDELKKQWTGAYYPFIDQIIGDTDARNLASAIRRALKARDELDDMNIPQARLPDTPRNKLLVFLVKDQRATVEGYAKLLESGECMLVKM